MIVTSYLFRYLLTIPSRRYSCVCHKAPWWTAAYSLKEVWFLMLTCTGPYSAIISDSCDHVWTYVGVLIKFYLSINLNKGLISLFIRVIYSIMTYIFVAFVDKVLFSYPDCFPVYVMTSIYYWIASKNQLDRSVLCSSVYYSP